MHGVNIIMEPDKKKYPNDSLIYTLIYTIKKLENKINKSILNETYVHYGYSYFKFVSYHNVNFTINNTTFDIYFNRCLNMVAYDVPSKNGISSIRINNTLYYLNDIGFYTLDKSEKYIDLNNELSLHIKQILNDIN